MPAYTGIYVCNHCQTEFNATSETFSTCACGKTSIRLQSMSVVSKTGSAFTKVSHTTHYAASDIVDLPDAALSLIERLRDFKQRSIGSNTFGCMCIHESYVTDVTGARRLDSLWVSNDVFIEAGSRATNAFHLRLSLLSSDYVGDEIATTRLQRYIDLLERASTDPASLRNRKTLDTYAETEDVPVERTPTGEYNHDYYL